jgi:hypothetical protein
MYPLKRVSEALPVLNNFLLFWTAPFAHKGVEEGLERLETELHGFSNPRASWKHGLIYPIAFIILYFVYLIFLMGASMVPAFSDSMDGDSTALWILGSTGAALVAFLLLFASQIGALVWVYRSAGKQRERLLAIASTMGIRVQDHRGILNFGIEFIGSTLFWVIFGIFIWSYYLAFGPVVRQFRTVRMYNEIVDYYNMRSNNPYQNQQQPQYNQNPYQKQY